MDSIRVERLRSLSDTGDIKIKPLTVLLGQNSSGKSSFLRVFPLLKQSVESRTTGPILWSGRLVDFGSFNDAHKRKSDNNIAFSFKFKLESERSNYLLYMDLPYILLNPQPLRILNSLNIELTLQVSQDQKKQTTIASRLILKLEDSEIKLEFNDDEYVTHNRIY
jgi:AAA15 family ATPase/GTPase